MKHPIQPIAKDEHGTYRFKENRIVQFLLKNGGYGLNDLAEHGGFSQEDWEQFAQLIGYSLSGFGELSYVSEDTYDAASKMAREGKTEEQSRIDALTELVSMLRKSLREPMSKLYCVAPEDLKGD